MPDLLSQPPPKISFSKNRLIIKVSSDDFLNAPGSAAVTTITFPDEVSSGDMILINWPLGTVTMKAANNPDNSGTQFRPGIAGAGYVLNQLSYFTANYFIDRDFIVTAQANTLKLTARKKGLNYNIIPENTGINVTTVPGTNREYKPNFAHYLQVYIVGESEELKYSRQLIMDQPVNGVSTTDISEILNTYVDYDIPSLTQFWQMCTKSVKQFYLKHAQAFGEPANIKKLTRSANYTICLGGYSEMALGVIGEDAGHFANYLLPTAELISYQRWFETFPRDNFDVTTNQPMFMYFMNNAGQAENLSLQAKLTFSDGTTSSITKPGGVLGAQSKVCIACGYQQLGLQAYTTAERFVTGYEIYLVAKANNQRRSVSKFFTVNREHEEYTRFILYSDSAGNFKTLRTHGRSKPTSEMEDNQAKRFSSINTPKTGDITRYDIKLIKKDELHTGYLTEDQALDCLEELLLAKYAFRVFGDALVPIIITSDKLEGEEDGSFMFSHKIEYRLAYDERLYTGSTGSLIVPRLNTSQNALNDL